jgi:hypothetical protein
MPWPVPQDFNEALQDPSIAFSDPDLKVGEAVCNTLGLPVPRSGNFADVYELNGADGKKWAVKCFTREMPGLHDRYASLSEYLGMMDLPFMVGFSYLDEGVKIRGQWYPIVKMEWVEGQTLNQFVKEQANNPVVLDVLCQIWLKLAQRLREADMAHCDLQHGNILLVPGSKANALAVRLIDYDGMLIPALAEKNSGEIGHPAYQHPQRLREGTYSPELDRFPHLVIYTALRALKVGGRALWDRYDNGDNLLFRQTDLSEPAKSKLFQELLGGTDAEVRQLAKVLKQAAESPLEQTPLLETALIVEKPKPKVVAKPKPQEAFTAAELGAGSPEVRAAAKPRLKSKEEPQGYGWPVIAGGVAAVLLVVGLGVFFAMRSGRSTHPPTRPAPVVAKLHPKTEPKTEPKVETKKEADPDPEPVKKIEKKKEADPNPYPRIEPPKDTRTPVPSGADQAAAFATIKSEFKADYAKLSVQKNSLLALASKLQKRAAVESDVAVRYVLLREARDLCLQAAAVGSTMTIVEEMARDFAVKTTEFKIDAIEELSKKAVLVSANKQLTTYALTTLDEALSGDDLEGMDRLLKAAALAAKNSGSTALVSTVQERTKEVEVQLKEHERMQEVAAILEKMPKDKEANLTMGRHLCFTRGEWDRGLLMLSIGADGKLKEVAEFDLTNPPAAVSQAELGDGWWELAQSAEGAAKNAMKMRACYWYRQARGDLNEETKKEVEARLKQMPTVYLADLTEEVVKEGPWKLGKGKIGNPDETKISVNGKKSPNGLGMHPPANGMMLVKYKLDRSARQFQSGVGVDDSAKTGAKSPIFFAVVGDGKVLWTSRSMQRAGSRQECKLSIAGVGVLELHVYCRGDNDEGANGVWIEPHLLK